jgi:taurine dioxygenase
MMDILRSKEGTTTMEISPAEHGKLGAEVRGVDLTSVGDETARSLLDAVHRHALVRLKDQRMTVHQYLEFGRKLGTMMPYPDSRYHHPEYPDVFVSSNAKSRDRGMARSGYFWHTDLSFKPKPQPLTVLFPQVLPQTRRETLFVNMANVFDALPAHLRAAVEGRTAKHDPVLRYKVGQADVDANLDLGELIAKGRQEFPAPDHPCVITHPVTKRRILYINEGFTTAINGLPYEASQAALEELLAFIRRPEHVQSHVWELGDVIIWDNRMLIHRSGGMAPGEISTIFRLGVDDQVPFYEGIVAA